MSEDDFGGGFSEARSIAFFIPDLSGGGVERMRLRLAASLLARGYEVTLILQEFRGALQALLPAGLRVVVLHQPRCSRSVVPLAALLRALQPDVLVSSLDHNNIVALCAGVLAGRRSRLVICQHNALSSELGLGWRYRAVPLLYRILAPFADGIVAVSEGVAQDLSMLCGIRRGRIEAIANPVADAQPEMGSPGMSALGWRADAGQPIFVFAGRLVAQKDPFLLLEAFALLPAGMAARLIVLGDGPLRPGLEARAASLGLDGSVWFGGFVADINPFLAAATALVSTSAYEGFGNVIVEALARGTPVIATDCPHGPAEILHGGQYGILVPVGDAPAIAAAMAAMPHKCFDRNVLRARAAAFSIDACADRHAALFQRLQRLSARPVFGLILATSHANSVASACLCAAPSCLRLVVTPNLDHIRLLRDTEFRAAYHTADVVCADGFPVALYGWFRHACKPRRVTGCDILAALLRDLRLSGARIAAVVESHNTAETLRAWIEASGQSGVWHIVVAPRLLASDDAAQKALCRDIKAFAPSILLMTLGAPTSEVFIHANRSRLPACWALCVGQALRVELGLAARAPRILRALGLEWAWRVVSEPRRLGLRYAAASLWFPVAVIRDLIGNGQQEGSSFSEEKAAKRLLPTGAAPGVSHARRT